VTGKAAGRGHKDENLIMYMRIILYSKATAAGSFALSFLEIKVSEWLMF
jgi:hypothetical protein